MTAFSLVIDVAGAALFALVGVGVLLLSRGQRRGLLVGAAATSFGLTWVFQNFALAGGPAPVAELGLAVSSVAATLAFVALAHHLVQGLGPSKRRRVFALGAVLALLWVAMAAWYARFGELAFIGAAYVSFLLALVLLVGVIAVAFEARAGSGAMACLGLAFGPFVVFLMAGFAGSAGFTWRFGTGLDLAFLALGATTAVAIVPFARSGRHGEPLSRVVFPALLAAGCAGPLIVVFADDYDGYGSFGIIRTLGAFFLALGVLKFDLLGVPLPRLAAQRGTLATAALASLFIVAQVAQEFFAAEYGLLMGGIVAGALLFAANPIQRAIERATERQGASVAVREAPAAGDSAREAAYRKAVRLALRDRRLTREEELHLHEIAEQLGISGRRAHAILMEAEAEAAGGAPP